MDSEEKRQPSSRLEHLLYGAIILMTAGGVVFYNVPGQSMRSTPLTPYLGALYFGFLTWAFSELNSIHRKRRRRQNQDLNDFEDSLEAPPPEPVHKSEPAPVAVRNPIDPPRTVLGLTVIQLAIVMVVFLIAFVTFTWALSVLRVGE